jgi:putative transposase
LSRPHSAKGLTSVPDAAWETARRRERIVRALLQNPGAYGARSEAVAATELDVTIQYLYRLIKVYEAAKHRAEREFHGTR